MHATILSYMFSLVETDKIKALLYDPSNTVMQATNNADFVHKYSSGLLKVAFPHLQEYVDLSSCLTCKRNF